ncbi:endoribonuclease YbeY isoform X2 [Microcaecilia unicolor]|uniref:Endoribonuclease YbeY isoform X2 n=1 Tax=Microcaecilia unicolor TaxID=1415580 RepID=A0A6P7YTF0_9AMPH|nr:endoribonuclease YbeY isoform X2 [Microcaecilia unicolor]
MTLVLRNLQIVIPLRRAVLRRNMEALRHILGVKEYDLGVICVDNRKIQLINYQYKKKNCPTDVLSFPFQENLAAGELPQPSFPDDYNLGDIFLGVEFIYQQCQEQKDDFYSVMTVTAAHGMCHLLGYQHRSEAEWRQMFEKEKQILEVLSRLTGRNLQPLTENYNSLSRTHTPVIKRETCPKIGFEQLTKDNLQASD